MDCTVWSINGIIEASFNAGKNGQWNEMTEIGPLHWPHCTSDTENELTLLYIIQLEYSDDTIPISLNFSLVSLKLPAIERDSLASFTQSLRPQIAYIAVIGI
jgi:hypothetical protein